jgi:hypothetical protein
MQSLGPPPNQGSSALPVGPGSSHDIIPDFSLDEMHRQIIKFIVADDQVSSSSYLQLPLIIAPRLLV